MNVNTQEYRDNLKKEFAIRRRVEIAAWDLLPPVQRVASVMHDVLCHSNHVDQCGWHYKIDGWGEEYTHIAYEAKAVKALEIADEATVISLFISLTTK